MLSTTCLRSDEYPTFHMLYYVERYSNTICTVDKKYVFFIKRIYVQFHIFKKSALSLNAVHWNGRANLLRHILCQQTDGSYVHGNSSVTPILQNYKKDYKALVNVSCAPPWTHSYISLKIHLHWGKCGGIKFIWNKKIHYLQMHVSLNTD